MVGSNSHRSAGQKITRKSNRRESYESIHDFLTRELPPGKANQAAYLTEAVQKAGARYDRYAEKRNRKEWQNYSARANMLNSIKDLSVSLASYLSDLDILTRDDLETQIDPTKIETLIGSLVLLNKEANALVREIQKSGRPRDLAEERWVLELADIYENAFNEPPSVWRSTSGSVSKFYSFLELSRPETFPRFGKLSRRQIDRMLKLRDRFERG